MTLAFRCPLCSLELPYGEQAFCIRCGGRMRAEDPSEQLARRLATIRRVVRSRTARHNSVVGQLTQQFEQSRELLADPEARVANGVPIAWLSHDLLELGNDPDVRTTLRLLKLAAKFEFPVVAGCGVEAARAGLADLEGRLSILCAGLGEIDSDVRAKKPSEKRFRASIASLARKTGVAESFVVECIRRVPVHWPRAATFLEPDRRPAVLRDRTVFNCRTAIREQNLGIARTKLEGVLDEDSSHVGALESLATVFLKMGEEARAIEVYRRAVEAGTDNPLTLNNLAWFASTTGTTTTADLHSVLTLARRAVELLPTGTQYDTLAEVFERLGRLDEAWGAMRRALQDDPAKEAYADRARRLASKWDEWHRRETPPTATTVPAHSPAHSDDVDVFDDADFDAADEWDDVDFAAPPAGAAPLPDGPSGDVEFFQDDNMEVSDEGSAFEFNADDELDEEWDSSHGDAAFDELDDVPGAAASERPVIDRGDFEANEAPTLDPVDCTVHAPPSARPGDAVLVQVFAHLAEQAADVAARATRVDPDAEWRNSTSLGTRIARGSRIDLELRMKHLDVDESEQSLVWTGEPKSVEFEVDVPETLAPRRTTGTLVVSQDSVPIGRVRFTFEVVGSTSAPPTNPVPTGEAVRFRRAFASYASPDRDEVLRRVQMARAVGIHCFQDVLDLEPGQRWARELYRRIDESDVLFLFWSSAARDSEWVAREWRYALETLGDAAIVPVLVEGPPPATPPPELQHLHFDDGVLYFMGR